MYKKIITLFISAAMSLLLCAGVSADESYDGYLYFTVERLTLGQGFAVEPTRVGCYNGDTLEEIIKKCMGEKLITDSSDYGGIYITGVKDDGEPKGWTAEHIPEELRAKIEKFTDRQDSELLSEFDYSKQSGWMYTMNDVFPWSTIDALKFGEENSNGESLKNGSVVRLHFSIYGYGEDLGFIWNNDTYAYDKIFADKSALIKKVADINYANEQADYGKSYTAAMKVLEDWDATAYEIQNAINNLRKTVKIAKSETDTQITLDVETNGKADIYVAFYNSDFTLKSVKVYNLSASDTIECTKETENYRIFVWDDMLPLESEIK